MPRTRPDAERGHLGDHAAGGEALAARFRPGELVVPPASSTSGASSSPKERLVLPAGAHRPSGPSRSALVSEYLPFVAAHRDESAWFALGDGTRRAIVLALAERPQSVGEIADGLPVTRPAVFPNTSKCSNNQAWSPNKLSEPDACTA